MRAPTARRGDYLAIRRNELFDVRASAAGAGNLHEVRHVGTVLVKMDPDEPRGDRIDRRVAVVPCKAYSPSDIYAGAECPPFARAEASRR